MKTSRKSLLLMIPLLAGLLVSTPFNSLHARGDRGSQPLAENRGVHGEGHGEGFNREGNYNQGYEHGYEHGYDHGYNHGYNRGDNWVDPAVGVGVGVEVAPVGVGVGVYEQPVQNGYYSPEPGVNINIGN